MAFKSLCSPHLGIYLRFYLHICDNVLFNKRFEEFGEMCLDGKFWIEINVYNCKNIKLTNSMFSLQEVLAQTLNSKFVLLRFSNVRILLLFVDLLVFLE